MVYLSTPGIFNKPLKFSGIEQSNLFKINSAPVPIGTLFPYITPMALRILLIFLCLYLQFL